MKEDILKLQRKIALESEGFFSATEDNIAKNNSLEFLIETPKSFLFGEEQYPTVFKKAACYAFFIIKNHVFFDGNKRTGTKSSLLFLKLNGWTLKETVTYNDIVQLALGIACNELDFEDIVIFFESNSIKLK
ncbi:MAG: type II toxin-antitoxin system death-on-curing family toxin [candidate division Zixibacteria bacterium]|nr:type II toxin-antitoxin system death-on-curing family toxin [Candidatus Tariuqbacter arcticus]